MPYIWLKQQKSRAEIILSIYVATAATDPLDFESLFLSCRPVHSALNSKVIVVHKHLSAARPGMAWQFYFTPRSLQCDDYDSYDEMMLIR